MAIDPPSAPNGFVNYAPTLESALAIFGAVLKASGRARLLAADGLDYLNPNANCGANELAATNQTGETR